ncbi:Flp pilus assembly protein CpaB [Acetobacter fallax]|uniref:Flp pilus assembly protein CpaB n=1 Tax=Acetobacter fallax TaxID=1737473 RepID=A0ABX0KCU4_9PROT|nr:Flp pilus assembly protein CpaB [Acetobacter fallax]NHO33623.1 Flp pilus assembly protein CpaB [Acetobacter fallax]NHO37210.1 Flp pilus assembly protein CpaB [Acetobacter fallax]
MGIHKYITYGCIFVLTVLSLFLLGKLSLHQDLPSAAPPPVVKTEPAIKILVAHHQLFPGEILKEEDLSDQTVPQSFRSFGTLLSSQRKDFIGTLLRVALPKGAQLRGDDVVHPGEGGFLAALLSPGMRGVSVTVDPASAAGSLIWPGDYVDVILIPANMEAVASSEHSAASQTILENSHVVAIDQTVIRGKNPSLPNQTARTAVLELTPENARKLALAQKLGRIVLTLRPLNKPDSGRSGSDITWNEDIFDASDKFEKPASDTRPAGIAAMRVFNGIEEAPGAH